MEGERFSFVLKYDNLTGELIENQQKRRTEGGPSAQVSFKSIFERNTNKLNLSGLNRPISKEEFLAKIEKIPFFTNLIRVETFVRDRN